MSTVCKPFDSVEIITNFLQRKERKTSGKREEIRTKEGYWTRWKQKTLNKESRNQSKWSGQEGSHHVNFAVWQNQVFMIKEVAWVLQSPYRYNAWLHPSRGQTGFGAFSLHSCNSSLLTYVLVTRTHPSIFLSDCFLLIQKFCTILIEFLAITL